MESCKLWWLKQAHGSLWEWACFVFIVDKLLFVRPALPRLFCFCWVIIKGICNKISWLTQRYFSAFLGHPKRKPPRQWQEKRFIYILRMHTQEQILEQISLIQQRNKRVELEKEREQSTTRKICIALLTYGVIVVFFIMVHAPNPRINAIVPTLWFLLSTLSLHIFKHIWIKWIRK